MDLERYKWKNRILVILFPADDPQLLNTQKEYLEDKNQGLLERKLLLIGVNEKGYQVLDRTQVFVKDPSAYKALIKKSGNQNVLLIGLDGGIKYRSSNAMSSEELFSIIDGMPMRQSELRSKN